MPNLDYEKQIVKEGFSFVGGVDEAGRGPLAGPVVAAAVILQKNRFRNRIDDSKALSALQRENAYSEIMEKASVGVGIISHDIIDASNIVRATILAMENAVYSCLARIKNKKGAYFIVDGLNINLNIPYPFKCIVRGDKKSLSISAASIIAKVTRDRIMRGYDKIYPDYGFAQHKGYPTREHILRLVKFGVSDIHRKTFFPVSEISCGQS